MTNDLCTLLDWLCNVRTAHVPPDRARHDAAFEAAIRLADTVDSPAITPSRVAETWRQWVDAAADEPDPEDCPACGALDDTCPYHRGVAAGIDRDTRLLTHRGHHAAAELLDAEG